MQTPQFFLNRKDGSIVAAFVDSEPKRAALPPPGDLVHLPFGRPRHVQSGEDYVSLDPTAVRTRSEPRRKKSGGFQGGAERPEKWSTSAPWH